MALFNYFSTLFKRKPLSPFRQYERIIKRMGYKRDGEGQFKKENSSGLTMIWFSESGVRIKVYVDGYAESDFLSASNCDIEKLKRFIIRNEL
ncbi:hypothetical protein [Arcticibacterium luteifluviistationis]|uniref:Uncharacterized protein n=1 Tax=Arcticibacterium luteifluviistationis TaxID=1784714 RepID=A0A2Z4G8N2_9BACT|nr:hypothetical protein [Arcticibacterium luteifluviistationis]AWV97516.1 hypothetical protein DJ013_04775 [Arcticibacterium luteifluviistationis]